MKRRTLIPILAFILAPASVYAQSAGAASGDPGERALSQALGGARQLAAQFKSAQAQQSKIRGTTPLNGTDGGWYESGYILAKPVRVAWEGAWKTWEAEVKVGGFPDDPSYIESLHKLSFESRDPNAPALVKRFQALDTNKYYLFKYKGRHWARFQIQDTHELITDIIDLPGQSAFAASNLPSEVTSEIGRRGTNNPGADRDGRITEVTRYDHWGKLCAFELTLSGISSGDTHSIDYAVYSEEECSYVEQLIKYQLPVRVHYSEDYVELWDYYTHIAHSVTVMAQVQNSAPAASSSTDAEYERFKEKLLNDPDFMKKLQERMSQGK